MVPVIGFLDVDSVTRAVWVFLPVRRSMRLGFAAVVVERVRAMVVCVECIVEWSRFWLCCAVSLLDKKREALDVSYHGYLSFYLFLLAQDSP